MITRTELLQRFLAHQPALFLIEAGAGFGKTALLEQLRAHVDVSAIVTRRPVGAGTLNDFVVELARAARRAGLDELEAAIAGASGDASQIARALLDAACWLLLDDLDSWDDDARAAALAIVADLEDRAPCIIAGRSLRQFDGLIGHRDVRTITSRELAFTEADVAQLVVEEGGEEPIASLLFEATQGWPLATSSLVTRLSGSMSSQAVEKISMEHENLIDGLLRACLSELSSEDANALGLVAVLPFFDDDIANTIGAPGLIQRLAMAGVPITLRPDGWLEITEQFRHSLVHAAPTPAVAVDTNVLQHYVERGEVNAAISVCLQAGNHAQAAELIGSLSNNQQTRLDPSTLNAAITTIGDMAARAPRCLLVQCQVNGTFGRMPEGLQAIERAVEYFDAQSTPAAGIDDSHREALLELGLWRYFTGQAVGAQDLLDRAADGLDGDSRPDLLARVHDLRGLLYQDQGTEEALLLSAAELTEALRIWRSIAEPRPAAATVFRLAGGLLPDLGRRGEALGLLDSVAAMGPMTLINRARVGLERSALLTFLGRADEVPAVTAEVRRLALLLGHPWLAAWTYWNEIVACSVTGPPARLGELLRDYDDQGLAIGHDRTQAGMWCDVAEAFARCGLHAQAQELFTRARALEGLFPWYLDYTEASLEARGGDAQRALSIIEALDLVSEVDHDRRWRIELLRSLAHVRLSSVDEALKYLDRAFAIATDLGDSQLPLHLESALVARVRSGNVAAPSAEESADASLHVSLFGDFAVTSSGQPVSLPRGQVSDLVKLLVLADGSLVADQIIDRLWPEVSSDVGRRRLRNLLGRLREHCPELVERSAETLRLGNNVASDFATARTAARDALAAGANPIDGLDHAIQLNRGELIPADRYAEWAEEAREEQRSLLIRLLDAKAARAEQAGDQDSTVEALLEAHALDPFFSSRSDTAAEILRSATVQQGWGRRTVPR